MRHLSSIAAIGFAVFGASVAGAAEKNQRIRGLVQGDNQVPCDDVDGCSWGNLGSSYTEGMWVAHPNVFWRCNEPGMVALTYDDGPSLETANVLDQLKAEDVVATFFINGIQITDETGPLLTRAEVEGHVIAHHTYDHFSIAAQVQRDGNGDLTPASLAFFAHQIDDNVVVASPYLPTKGLRPYLRPPFLELDEDAASYLQETYEMYVVQINVDTKDYEAEATTSSIENAFSGNLYDDSTEHSWISLQHDLYSASTAAIPDMIAYGKSQGYRFVGIDECLGFPNEKEPEVTTKTPTIPQTDPPLRCDGDPCREEPDLCRSKFDWCGATDAHCLDEPTWVPACDFTPSPTTSEPTMNPTNQPSTQPTNPPSNQPTNQPSYQPTTSQPTMNPTTAQPTAKPTTQPTTNPTTTTNPTSNPTTNPSIQPTTKPSTQPTTNPTKQPTTNPTKRPTLAQPTAKPTAQPTTQPSKLPTMIPSKTPSTYPTNQPSNEPSLSPTLTPSKSPSTLAPTKLGETATATPSIFTDVVPTTTPQASYYQVTFEGLFRIDFHGTDEYELKVEVLIAESLGVSPASRVSAEISAGSIIVDFSIAPEAGSDKAFVADLVEMREGLNATFSGDVAMELEVGTLQSLITKDPPTNPKSEEPTSTALVLGAVLGGLALVFVGILMIRKMNSSDILLWKKESDPPQVTNKRTSGPPAGRLFTQTLPRWRNDRPNSFTGNPPNNMKRFSNSDSFSG